MRAAVLVATFSIALAACQQQPAAEGESADAAEKPGAATASPLPQDSAQPAPTEAADKSSDAIPVALQGRWGMVPADCTSTRGDAKGLLTVAPRSLKFYESAATLDRETARSDSMIRGTFAFSGEGQTWTRDQTLSVSGDTLTRIEHGPSTGSYSYTRCAG